MITHPSSTRDNYYQFTIGHFVNFILNKIKEGTSPTRVWETEIRYMYLEYQAGYNPYDSYTIRMYPNLPLSTREAKYITSIFSTNSNYEDFTIGYNDSKKLKNWAFDFYFTDIIEPIPHCFGHLGIGIRLDPAYKYMLDDKISLIV